MHILIAAFLNGYSSTPTPTLHTHTPHSNSHPNPHPLPGTIWADVWYLCVAAIRSGGMFTKERARP